MNWSQRLEIAQLAGHFTEDDVRQAYGWCTCAVGEKFSIEHKPGDLSGHDLFAEVRQVPRPSDTPITAPNNSNLVRLGAEFYLAVVRNQVDKALELYHLIRDVN